MKVEKTFPYNIQLEGFNQVKGKVTYEVYCCQRPDTSESHGRTSKNYRYLGFLTESLTKEVWSTGQETVFFSVLVKVR